MGEEDVGKKVWRGRCKEMYEKCWGRRIEGLWMVEECMGKVRGGRWREEEGVRRSVWEGGLKVCEEVGRRYGEGEG